MRSTFVAFMAQGLPEIIPTLQYTNEQSALGMGRTCIRHLAKRGDIYPAVSGDDQIDRCSRTEKVTA
jgi:hypothetical protein